MKRLDNLVFRLVGAGAVLMLCCLLFCPSCSRNKPEEKPELRDYYDPYAPSPKSKFDSVRTAAMKLLADKNSEDSIPVTLNNMDRYEWAE
jgi:hypothetical protein